MQSASRSTLSFQRWSCRALPALAAALLLVMPAFAQAPGDSATTLTAESTPTGSQSGSTITLTAHVAAASGSNATPPTTSVSNADPATDPGSVTFLDTDSSGQVRELGSAVLSPDGVATLKVSSLLAGAHAVRAVFSGNESAKPSTSAAADLTAQATATPDFNLSAAPTSLNLQAGVQGSVAVTIAPVNGFSNYVSLSCAGLPLYSTCTFLPSNVSVGASGGLSTMTLATVAPSGKVSSLRRDTGLVYAFLLPGALGLAGLGLCRNRSLRALAVLCVVGSLMAGAGSCAQRYTYLHRGPSPNPGTPNGRSVIRVFGTSVNGAQAQVKCVQVALNVISTNTSSSGNILTPCP